MRRSQACVVAVAAVLALLCTGSAIADHSNLEHVSLGPAGGNGPADATFKYASTDGSRVFFQTQESLVLADIDSEIDVYERFGAVTTLISTSATGGNGAAGAGFAAASEDGTRVLFSTAEQLSAGDSDSNSDIYERFAGDTTLISTGPAVGTARSLFRSTLLASQPTRRMCSSSPRNR